MHQLCSQYVVPLPYEVVGHLTGFRVRYCRHQVSRLAPCPATHIALIYLPLQLLNI